MVKYINKAILKRSMQIELPADTSEKVKKASDFLGIEKKELVDRAILVYLDDVKKLIELKKEMKEWDMLRDEALAVFDKSL